MVAGRTKNFKAAMGQTQKECEVGTSHQQIICGPNRGKGRLPANSAFPLAFGSSIYQST